MLEPVMTHLGLSARAHDRMRKVARTIADMEGSKEITAAMFSDHPPEPFYRIGT